jgi:hypothetical protein
MADPQIYVYSNNNSSNYENKDQSGFLNSTCFS